MMIDPEILFRRRVAIFIASSAFLFIALVIGLRISYKNLVKSVISEYGQTQQQLVSQVAAIAEQDFDLLGWRVRQAAAIVKNECIAKPAGCSSQLNAQYDLLAADGALDIVFQDNNLASRVTVSRFFEQQSGWPPEVDRARTAALSAETSKVFVSQVFSYTDKDKKERPGVAFVVPVFDMMPEKATPTVSVSGTPAPAATETRKVLTRIGCVVVPVSFTSVSKGLQEVLAVSKNRNFVMLSPGERILSHIDPAYIGSNARELLNFSKNPRLENIIGRALEGKKGVEDYDYASESQQSIVKAWITYSSLNIEGGPYTVALYYREKDIPLANNFFWRYVAMATVCLLLLVLINILPLIEHKQHLTTSVELKRMHDVNAINDMLRNVNSELTETKRVLETKTREVHALHEQRLHILEQVTNTQYRLFGTIKKPSREQRELMRALKRDIQAMGRSPEGRFWKKAEADLDDE